MRGISCLGLLLLVLAVGCERAERKSTAGGAEPTAPESTVQPAELVFRNGYIYTVDGDRRIAQAMAVCGGRIVFVGSDGNAEPYIGPDTQVENLQGRLVLPGFVDASMHLRGLGSMVDLSAGNSVADYQQAVAEFIREYPERQLIVGVGWDETVFTGQPPHKGQLDQVSDTIPIILFSSDYHSIWANSEALAAAGINNDTPDPPGGVIEKDDTGLAIGVLREESAMALVEKIIPEKTEEDYRAGIRRVQEDVSRWGITTLHDAGIKPEGEKARLAAYRKLAAQGELNVRVRVSFEVDGEATSKTLNDLQARAQKFQDDDFQVHSVRVSVGGVRGEEVDDPKQSGQQRPDYRGRRPIGPDELRQLVKRANARELQVQVHASDDAATRMALDAFAHSRDINGPRDWRNSIAHLQRPRPEDLDLFSETRTIALVRPLRFALGNDNRERPDPGTEYPMKSFFERDITVASGSGYPVDRTDNPLVGIQVGITRRGPDTPADESEWETASAQRVTLEQMLESFTINGAFANRLEKETGSLESGKWADFIVLDKNLFQIEPKDIHRAKVLRTYYKGELVFDAESGPPN